MPSPLSEYRSAGFVVTRSVPRPSYVSAELLPEAVVSLSGCIASFVPDTWCIEWTGDSPEQRRERAGAFDLDEAALAELTAWATARFGDAILSLDAFFEYRAALEVVERFLACVPSVKLLEIALHQSLVDEFCRAAEPPPPQPGYAPFGRGGILEAILKERSPTEGGRLLGFEPLLSDFPLSCSWLCNGLESLVAEQLGIRPNAAGLIATFEEACRCVEFISRDEIAAEPGLWLPWLVIEHAPKEP